MLLRWIKPTLFAVILTLAATFAPAVTLQPGEYKLEWTIPEDGETFSENYASGELRVMDPQSVEKVQGLSSANPYLGRIGNFTVIVDESEGIDTGYNTAYLVHGEPNPADIDISKSPRIGLSPSGQWREANDSKWHPVLRSCPDTESMAIDVPLGEPGNQTIRTARVELAIRMLPDEQGRNRPHHGEIGLRGCWQGTVDTDSGPLAVRTVDRNKNGVYGEMGASDYEKDAVLIEPGSSDLFDIDLLPLGDVAYFDGKLYSMKVNKIGDTLEVRPYSGEAGRLKVQAVDGFGRQADRFMVELHNTKRALCINSENGSEFSLPLGNYKAAVLIGPKQGLELEEFALSMRLDAQVEIDGKSKVVLKAGGPIKVTIAPDEEVITARAGEELMVPLAFTVNGGELDYVMSTQLIAVNIRDSKGKLLLPGVTSFLGGGVCRYHVQIPKDWLPGTYLIGASFDPRPYQKPVYAKKRLIILEAEGT